MAKGDKIDTRIELLATLVLSLATIATAWSVYEAARWSGVQAVQFSAAGSARTTAAAQLSVGAELGAHDAAAFAEYQRAARQGDVGALAEIQSTFFRPEFRRVFEAWRAGRGSAAAGSPFELAPVGAGFALAERYWDTKIDGTVAPVRPLELTGYRPAAFERSDALTNEADLAREAAKEANEISDNYVLTTVLFACVLFFAGICTKFASRMLQVATLTIGGSLFLGGGVVLTQLPFH